MQRRQSFGRRAPERSDAPSRAAAEVIHARANEGRPLEANPAAPPIQYADEVDRELEEWKEARKIRKRSFREPWRSVCIAATLGFGLSSWLLPDSVANVAELVTTGLAVASFIAGYRKR